MEFNEGAVVLKEIQRLYTLRQQENFSTLKIWLSSDAYRGIAEHLQLEEYDKLLLLTEITKRGLLPSKYVEKTFDTDYTRNMSGSIPDILCYFERENFSFYIAEEVKKKSSTKSISQILCFRPWVNFCYGVMPNPSKEVEKLYQEQGVGLIQIWNPSRIQEWNKLEKEWKIILEPRSHSRYEYLRKTYELFPKTNEKLLLENNKYILKNPLITSCERKDIFSIILSVLKPFKIGNEYVDINLISNLFDTKLSKGTIRRILSCLKKLGLIYEENGKFFVENSIKEEVFEFNYQLSNNNMNIKAYNSILLTKIRSVFLSNYFINSVIKCLQKLNGGANMVKMFEDIGMLSPYLLYELFTNMRNPHNVDYEKERICKECNKSTPCAEFLKINTKEKFEEIWKSTGAGAGFGSAVDFFDCLKSDDVKAFNRFLDDKETFPLYVKFSVAQSLTFGKAHLSSLGILDEDIIRNKARGEYCPWEDYWILSKES